MHQIRFRLGLPQTPLGKFTTLPRPLAGFKRPISKESEGRKDGREGQGRKKGEGRGTYF